MSKYGIRIDPKVNIGNSDLFSQFSDFALYLQEKVMYEHINFGLWVNMLQCLIPNKFKSYILWFSDFDISSRL